MRNCPQNTMREKYKPLAHYDLFICRSNACLTVAVSCLQGQLKSLVNISAILPLHLHNCRIELKFWTLF